MNQSKLYHEGEYRILTATDLHLKVKNPKTRYNYIQEQYDMINTIVETVLHYKINLLIWLGDIYDGDFVGPKSDSINLYFLSRMQHLKSQGVEIYTLMGNHEKHKYMNSLCPLFKVISYGSEKIIKELSLTGYGVDTMTLGILDTTDQLIINDKLCITMHHFSDNDKTYLTEPNDYRFNLGLFHDAILPSKARKHIHAISNSDVGKYSKVAYNDKMLNNLDYAVFGDIHAKIGEMLIQTETGECLADIPGSLMRTQSGIAQAHESVDLPMFILNGDTLTKEHINIKMWEYDKSFKKDIVTENKKKYADLKELKNNLEQVVVKKNFIEDRETFSKDTQVILGEILDTGDFKLKDMEEIVEFIK